MAESPVPCREPFTWAECERPYGHDGYHAIDAPLPPEIQSMVDFAIAQAQAARRRLNLISVVLVGALAWVVISTLIQ